MFILLEAGQLLLEKTGDSDLIFLDLKPFLSQRQTFSLPDKNNRYS